MRVIIAGIGDVGFHLAKLMSSQNHDIVIIDTDKEKISYAEDHLDIISYRGSSSSFKTLKEARVEETDLFLAVTNADEVNLTSCMIAKKMGAQYCIARISNAEYNSKTQEKFFVELGVDSMIFPEDIAAREINRLITKAEFTEYFDFFEKKLSLAALYVEEGAPLVNRTVDETSDLNPQNDFLPVAILRDGETIIPRRHTKILADDLLYFVMEPQGIHKVIRMAGSEKFKIDNIMIIGGGKIGKAAALLLQEDYHVKLIEKDKDRSFELADQLTDTLVINADGRDVEFLEEEDIENMDAFIALSGDAETNIISSIVAKNHNVKKTIALVDNIDYINISQNIGIDALINKKLIAANNIFRYVRKGDISDLVSLPGLDAEMLEFIVGPECKINNRRIKDLGFPKDAIIAGVIRNNRGYVTMGDFVVEERDRVIVVTLQSSIKSVEAFFAP